MTATDSVAFFAEALTLTRRRQDLAPLVERTIERLHGEGMRAYAEPDRAAWLALALRDPEESSRRFWAVAIGVMVEGHAMGRSAEELCSRDAARAGRSGDDTDRGRQRQAAPRRRPRHPIQVIRRGDIIMTALRMRARDFLNEDQLIAVRQRVTWKGDRPDRACVGADIGLDRAGGVVAQSADLSAGGRHHRLAPARACDPDA